MKKAVLILCVFSLLSFAWLDNTSAAPPQYYNYNTPGGANQFPFNMSEGKKVQLLYLPGDFNQPSAAPGGTITSVAFRINETYPLGPWTYSNFTIRMGQSSITSFTSGAFYGGSLTTVYTRSSVTLQGTAGDWMTITLDTPFTYDPTQSLIVDVEQTGVPGAVGYSACATTVADNRRIWSQTGATSTYESLNNTIYHFGINLTSNPISVPTINQWGMIIFMIFAGLVAGYNLRKYRRTES
jgi:hypothetical protein